MRPRMIEAIGCLVPLILVGEAIVLLVTERAPFETAAILFTAAAFGDLALNRVLYLIPVRCFQAGCTGWMRRHCEYSRYSGRIIYTCTKCGGEYNGWTSWDTDPGRY